MTETNCVVVGYRVSITIDGVNVYKVDPAELGGEGREAGENLATANRGFGRRRHKPL